ncbi:MAG: T9SS type A sorting domain-containing protein [Bacteroidota bacterium]
MRRTEPLAIACALLLLVGGSAQAQGLPVVWDSLGAGADRRAGSTFTESVAQRPGAPGDTLWMTAGAILYRLLPDQPLFGPAYNETINPGPSNLLSISPEGVFATTGMSYSTDGGVTWLRAEEDTDGDGLGDEPLRAGVNDFCQTEHPLLGGVLFAAGVGGVLWASTDGGQVWSRRTDWGGTGFRDAYSVTELRAGPHAGRVVVGLLGRLRYSDDGGVTWSEGSGVPGRIWDVLTEGPDGTVYAAGSGTEILLASRDGGASWTVRYTFGEGEFLPTPQGVRLAVANNGTLWAGLTDYTNTTEIDEGTFVYSVDEGQSWTEAAEGFGRYEVNELLIDGRGRLVAATDAGVWRTRGSVSVSEESATPSGMPSGAVLDAPYPNPAAGTMTIPLALSEETAIRVTVMDVLGREVAVVHAGLLAAGRHTLAFDTRGLAAGVYVVSPNFFLLARPA